MLYVFLVDNGTMLVFDMNLALESVFSLKEVIFKAHGIPPEKQVLLISGGLILLDNERVCTYSAGTDTNPIFLFSKASIESQSNPVFDLNLPRADVELVNQVESMLDMPASYNTVVARAQLAKRLHEHGLDVMKFCADNVHHQHLQQQGWAAVMANLDDILTNFKKKFENFRQHFYEFLQNRDHKYELINNFDDDIRLLEKIPVIPALLQPTSTGDLHTSLNTPPPGLDNNKGEKADISAYSTRSLKDWINSYEKNNKIEDIKENCRRGLDQVDTTRLANLEKEVTSLIADADRKDMKDIKGLCERLSGLEKLMHDGNLIVKEQENCSKNILSNCQNKTEIMHDATVLNNFCHSHKRNLIFMQKNDNKLLETKKKCLKAKEELSGNLYHRLKWVMHIENKLTDWDTKLDMHRENIRRLDSQINIIEQIHRAPQVYVSAITEVVRRQMFSKHFMSWAVALSAESLDVYDKEVNVRKEFFQNFSSHFLNTFFPGMEDMPPAFAADSPGEFDQRLPKLTAEDLEYLKKVLPELSSLLIVKEVAAIPPMLQSYMQQSENPHTTLSPSSLTYVKEGSSGNDVYTSAVTTTSDPLNDSPDQESSSRIRTDSNLKDSETDTEEFEKVCNSAFSPMDAQTDARGSKTKQHFSCQPTDSKHIKLDGSHLKVEEDSYTESNSTNTTNGSNPLRQATSAGAVKSHHYITAELQKQLDEKNDLILKLEGDVLDKKDECESLQKKMDILASLNYEQEVISLKTELSSLREKVKDEGASYINYVTDLSSRLFNVLVQVQKQVEEDKESAIQSAITESKGEEQNQIMQLMNRVDLQSHQIIDANRELDFYRDELTRLQETVQHQNFEHIEQLRTVKEEKDEISKNLSLEHEVEMVALKEQWAEESNSRQLETNTLMQRVTDLECQLKGTLGEKENLENLMEAKFAEKLQEETLKLEQTLEVKFDERQNSALEDLRNKLEKEQDELVSNVKKTKEAELVLALEELRAEMGAYAFNQVVEAEEKARDDMLKASAKWEAEKEEEVASQLETQEKRMKEEHENELERVKQQYKLEVEGLRSRYRMMTTANMERSPSETSLEKFDRSELIEVGAHEVVLSKLREEMEKEKSESIELIRKNLEVAFQSDLKVLEEKKNEEFRKDDAEKQLRFNNAIRALTQDKERVIEDLRLRVQLLTDENEKLQRLLNNQDSTTQVNTMSAEIENLKSRCDKYQSENSRLEKELTRAKRMSFVAQSSHDMAMSFSDAVSCSASPPAPQEGHHGSSRRSHHDRSSRHGPHETVHINLCEPGQTVLVVWDELHDHYKVFLEDHPNLHFVHSNSYDCLGLEKRSPRRPYAFGIVVSKEFCQAKKDVNRFNVPNGTKFYRVTLKQHRQQLQQAMQRLAQNTNISRPIPMMVDSSSQSTLNLASSPTQHRSTMTSSSTTTTSQADSSSSVTEQVTQSSQCQSPGEGEPSSSSYEAVSMDISAFSSDTPTSTSQPDNPPTSQ